MTNAFGVSEADLSPAAARDGRKWRPYAHGMAVNIAQLTSLLAGDRLDESVAGFVPGPGIERLGLTFDIERLRHDLDSVVREHRYEGEHREAGFGALAVTRRRGAGPASANDLSGRYWLRRPDAAGRYVEEAHEEPVDESAFTELTPAFAGTYFETVLDELRSVLHLGRVRVLSKDVYNCNSWHRDPEPRIHLPIITNPGSLFIVNHHCTHLPADGSVYFTDTRGYHTALNGGPGPRVHLVAAVVGAACS